MPAPELVLRFPGPDQVNVSYDGTDSGLLPFVSPVTDKDRSDIRWYIETYGAHSLADPDDTEARRIQARLVAIGKDLFNAVFGDEDHRPAARLFNRFQDADAEHRVLTVDSQSAAVLSLPWELLHDPTGVFLFRGHHGTRTPARSSQPIAAAKPRKAAAQMQAMQLECPLQPMPPSPDGAPAWHQLPRHLVY